MSNLVGKTILERYNVQEFLGRGGMAEVYKVWDSHRMTYLAMKVILEDLAVDKVFMRRFKREADTLAKLQHPNIVRFYGLEQQGRLAFMLLDYIEGDNLKPIIFDAGGPLPQDKIRSILHSVCGALSYAHRENMVHCDIKSANIMLNKHGEAMLTDFGIARVTDAATATMVGVGTPAYMAPEQVRGEDPTPQTDIYSLGVVLFEMLTGGERPFTGEQSQTTGSTSEKVRWEQMNMQPPSPKKWNPDISPELEAVVMKCLEKDPHKRCASTLDIINALELATAIDETAPLEEAAPGTVSSDEIADSPAFTPINCPQCGTLLQPDWQACPKCMAALVKETHQPGKMPDGISQGSSSGRKFPKWAIVIGCILVGLLLTGSFAYANFGFHRTNQAAKLAPSDAISMITFSPGPIQLLKLLNVQKLVNAAPVFAAVPGVSELIISVQEDFDVSLQIDPVEDILPWIGRETSLVFLPDNYRTTGSKFTYSGMPFFVTIASRDTAVSAEFVLNMVTQLENHDYIFDTSTYHEVMITKITSRNVIPLAFANLEDMIVVASDENIMREIIDGYESDDHTALYEESTYKRLIGKLLGNRVGYIFLNWPVIKEEYSLVSTDFPYADQLMPCDGAGAAIKPNTEGLVLDFLISCDQDALSAFEFEELRSSFSASKLLDYSPENTLFFMSGKDIALTWNTLTESSFWEAKIDVDQVVNDHIDWRHGHLEDITAFENIVADLTGIHPVDDLFENNSKEFAFMVVSDLDAQYGDDSLPIGLLFAARMDDVKQGMDNLHQIIEEIYQHEDVNHHRESIDGINVWYLEDEVDGVLFGYTYWGDALLIGTSKNMIRAAIGNESPHLSGSDFFQTVTGPLSSKKNKMLYLNTEDTFRYAGDILYSDFPKEFKQYIDPIRAISISTEPLKRDGWLHGTISIYTK